jgi:eukaryotic-like serine/threonine-protein kinase
MDAARFQKVKDIFAEAAELSVESHASFVREKCGADEPLFTEVNSLLAAHDEAENIIEKNAFSFDSFTNSNGVSYDGKQFGNYKTLREIGRGGMGAVFLAERNDGEFNQKVALKIVRQTILDGETERHFRREREILASLNHPNIAHLHDGGVSERGEAFLAMEYVEGENLLEYAETNKLSVEEKLKLFLKICAAVAYAHRNLTIHRDLKPSNILVNKDGEPKLLDFGLAKMSEPSAVADGLSSPSKLSDNQLQPSATADGFDLTRTIFRAFTPAYASPEQILGRKITTASDVYSLGVVFYELLSGEKPFHFEGKSLEEIIKTITNIEPPPPSATSNFKFQISNSKNQRPKTKNLIPKLNSDIDKIALKALQKEPERRYKTVEGLANDIKRHLNGLPILARPSTFSYRASKFFKRNKIAVSAAALVLLSLVIGGVISFVQFRRAQTESAKNEEVRAFLQKMLLTANPENSKGFSSSVNEMLEQAANRLETEDFSRQPEVRAELEGLIGEIYSNQGQYEKGEKYLRKAIKEQIEIYGEDSKAVILNKIRLANLNTAKANYDEAGTFYEQNLPALREQNRRGELDVSVFLRALNNYALISRARGDSKQAESLFRENFELVSMNKKVEANKSYLRTMIALTQFDQGKFDEAETEMTNLLSELNQKSGEEKDFAVANALTLLGSIQMEKGNLNAAAENLQAAEKIYRKYYSPNFIQIFDNLRLQAQVSYSTGNYLQAEDQINQVLENYRQNANPKYISYATALTLQGLILNKLGRGAEAEVILREAVRLRTKNLPARHFLTALTKGVLGEILTANKKYEEAETLLIESKDQLKNLQAAENQRTLTAENRLNELYKVWNKPNR